MDALTFNRWVQKYISPPTTKLFAVAFRDRNAITRGIHFIARNLDERQQNSLRVVLNMRGILQPDYKDLPFKDLKHFHISKVVTIEQLLMAADDFYRNTGKDIFLKIVSEIIKGRTSGEPNINPHGVDHHQLIRTHKLLTKIKTGMEGQDIGKAEIVEQAFKLVQLDSEQPKSDLFYRMQKMVDIGGDIQAVIASLFMHIPAEKLPALFDRAPAEEIYQLKESIIGFAKRYQYMRDHFGFEAKELIKNEFYIDEKMSELTRGCREPQVLLMFLLQKLMEARKTQDASASIVDDIRFLYAPLAERLGLVFLADDFRDQVSRIRDPITYAQIERKVKARIGMGYESAKIFLSMYVKQLFSFLQQKLGPDFANMIMKFRVKSPFSLWNKVEFRREYSYDKVNDILGIKIIVDTEKVDPLFKLRDILKKNEVFITKSVKEKLKGNNGWHGIKLEGEDINGVPIEIQLMTAEMNLKNNRGKAATWKYNLEKELKDKKQTFDKLEPPAFITADFFQNFLTIKRKYAIPAEERGE